MAPASDPGTAAQFERALQLHQQGDLAGASALYEAVLTQEAAHFDALHLLGVVAAQSGDPARAITLIDRALAVDAAPAAAHFHRALALRDLGRQANALAGFTAVLARDPAHADAWINQAETLQALGRPAEALQSYDQAVALGADQPPLLFARGVLLQTLQRQADALADYDRVLALQPDFAGALNNRALALQALQRPSEALEAFDRLLAIEPGHAPAHHGRGIALASLNRHAEALAAYAVLLARESADTQAWFEQGTLLQSLHRHADALQSYDRALAIRPDFAEAHNNRALSLLALERAADALTAGERAIALRPDFAEAYCNRGVALSALSRHEEALASHQHAVALRPQYAEALFNCGHELLLLQRLPQALQNCEQALAMEPENPEFLYARGAVLHRMERLDEALATYDAALAQRPDHLSALANRGAALRALRHFSEAAACYARLLEADPDYPQALGNRLMAQLNLCDWSEYADNCLKLRSALAAGNSADMPFSHLAVTASAAEQRQCAHLYAADLRAKAQPAPAPRYRHPRIRLAYVSADLGFAPVAYLMAELFELHDRKRFEVTAIALRAPGEGTFDKRIQAAFDHYIDVSSFSEARIAALMREREIDIAIDLMGYTQLSRSEIFALRPAPVQAAYLGYAGTLDMGCIDYLIADPAAIPPASAPHYAEQLVHLPASLMPRDTTLQAAALPTRAACGLPERGFVFCCFNNAYKLNPPVFEAWMRLLKQVPGSVLWLSDPGAPAAENLRREAAARGVDPARLVLAAKTPRIEDHLARIALADLFLDTLPYNAHTTASDALWAGVPLLTCAGEAFASRIAASLLTTAGLAELITENLADYEALALRLAGDPARLQALRTRLRQQRAEHSLFSTARLRDHLEEAYLRMHARSQQGLAPQAFTIEG
jgi:predicted O-linked N-acetylglucosamine transferase (SPINDLY family)